MVRVVVSLAVVVRLREADPAVPAVEPLVVPPDMPVDPVVVLPDIPPDPVVVLPVEDVVEDEVPEGVVVVVEAEPIGRVVVVVDDVVPIGRVLVVPEVVFGGLAG